MLQSLPDMLSPIAKDGIHRLRKRDGWLPTQLGLDALV